MADFTEAVSENISESNDALFPILDGNNYKQELPMIKKYLQVYSAIRECKNHAKIVYRLF
ncbi:hypothetical protein [Pectinatus haikarae]|uniref:Uncharacterized protein n=1 Tax=Pectinatus haikarae TaxID=349096 RepID=A0ABT9YBN8_9FIRM|nr:hypothetical protein [Pectinatus haikarae]MDQ0205119.1 hypothetical protein [Pectinatus haikarae]